MMECAKIVYESDYSTESMPSRLAANVNMRSQLGH